MNKGLLYIVNGRVVPQSKMIGKTPQKHQMFIFEFGLGCFIDMNHELVLLSKQIEWDGVELEFAVYYCVDNGRPSVLIRKWLPQHTT